MASTHKFDGCGYDDGSWLDNALKLAFNQSKPVRTLAVGDPAITAPITLITAIANDCASRPHS